MGRGEIQRSVCARSNDSVGDGRGGRGIRDDKRRNAVACEDVGGHGAESFSEKTGITADDNLRAGRLFGHHVSRNAGDGATHIRKGKFLRNNCSPAGCAELDLSGHI